MYKKTPGSQVYIWLEEGHFWIECPLFFKIFLQSLLREGFFNRRSNDEFF